MDHAMFKLLIGYDGSSCAADAMLDLLRAGLPPQEVEATVLSIADLLPGVLGEDLVHDYPDVLKQARFRAQELVAEARKTSQEGAERLRGLFPDWQISADAAADSPYWGLVKRAEEWRADLLVVGSQGRSALGRLVLGSVSQNAVLYASCTTRVARRRHGADAVSSSTPVRIVVGWDGSADASSAVKAVAGRAWPPGSQARLVTAIDGRLSTALPAVLSAEPGTRVSPTQALDEADLLRAGARDAAGALRHTGLGVDDSV